MDVRTLYIGFDGEKVVDSAMTQRQIDIVKALECGLTVKGEPITWKRFEDPTQPSLFGYILEDRRRRVDEGTLMADRPPLAVVTVVGNRAVRLEYYEGHDELRCTWDLRAAELVGRDLPRWMEVDPHAYDPAKFLKDALGLPECGGKQDG